MTAGGLSSPGAFLSARPPAIRSALVSRVRTLLEALGRPPGGDPVCDLEAALSGAGPHELWFAQSVLSARLPDVAGVLRTLRAARLDGPIAALDDALSDLGSDSEDQERQVEVISGRVIVDVHHTVAHPWLGTGIQRVVRETTRRWMREHDPLLVGWTDDFSAMRRFTSAESDEAFSATGLRVAPASADRIVVPWKATVLVPELPADLYRPDIYQALVRFSRSTSGLIGHDCVPLTAAETTEGDMPSVFARYLCFAAHVDRIATTSEASTTEFRGWRAMLAGAGRSGPDIREVRLPTVARAASDEALGEARKLLCVGSMPVVLAVGSHEPRKNHLALVHAAEVLWREGLAFTLAFVGGHAWNSDRFVYEVDALQAINRPLLKIRGLSDDLLWAAYRLAHCTVFPSFHEGFGLPVAESLACGTPVITSNFGSMKQIASGGGRVARRP